MRVISLASSSVFGNAYLVAWGPTAILIDCGIPLRRLEKALVELGVDPRSVAAVFISHEHSDHIKAMQLKNPFPQKHDIEVFAPNKFWQAVQRVSCLSASLRAIIDPGTSVVVGGLQVEAFSKTHDAVAPLGFRVTCPDGTSVAVVTDLGEVTPDVMRGAYDCDYLIWESNHDEHYQLQSCNRGFSHPLSGKWIRRPYSLVKRVLSSYGHLSNEQAGQALSQLITSRTKGVMLAHLSIDCNTPDLALRTVAPYLRRCHYSGLLTVAQADDITVLADICLEARQA